VSLEHELGFSRPVELLAHEALLNIYYTASCLKKRADAFLRAFGLTDVQFNALMLLAHQSGVEGGLSQARLSDMMLVNRANITSLVDRMEKAGLVVRTDATGDRRKNIVKLTEQARKLLEQVEPLYATKVRQIMAVFTESQQKALITMLERIRSTLSKEQFERN